MNSPAFLTHWERLCGTLRALIQEDKSAVGYDRNDVRAKAKSWLIDHGASLAAEDVSLAKDHFGYLLPVGWGS
jgi:hypothetical protein